MCLLSLFTESLYEYLTGTNCKNSNIIRRHSKRLEHSGDVRFPLDIQQWTRTLTNLKTCTTKHNTIFDYMSPEQQVDSQIESLIRESAKWTLTIEGYQLIKGDVHLFLTRPKATSLCIDAVIRKTQNYGLTQSAFKNSISVLLDESIDTNPSTMTLSELRAFITQNVVSNITNQLRSEDSSSGISIKVTLKSTKKEGEILCGAVLNDLGVKSTKPSALELQKKRALDMQLMAQHKYGIQVKSSWSSYFERLGIASVILEMLQGKTHKATKVTLNSPQAVHKGPSFIFYNCARLSALFKEFDCRASKKVYPPLPPLEEIDFTLLNQPEEWEMVFVFLLHFPLTVTGCICDIKSGVVNLHNLVSFLSNLSSTFSIYYRRVKVLTNGKDHLLPVLFARMYLLKAVQQVFHTALHLLGIEPVKEM